MKKLDYLEGWFEVGAIVTGTGIFIALCLLLNKPKMITFTWSEIILIVTPILFMIIGLFIMIFSPPTPKATEGKQDASLNAIK